MSSYGVLASKSAAVLVETTSGGATRDATETDQALERFLGIWGQAWVHGRLTVTRLHANFIPVSAGRGMAMMDIGLRHVEAVELAGRRFSRVMAIHTPHHRVQVRAQGLRPLVPELNQLVAAAKRIPLPEN